MCECNEHIPFIASKIVNNLQRQQVVCSIRYLHHVVYVAHHIKKYDVNGHHKYKMVVNNDRSSTYSNTVLQRRCMTLNFSQVLK